MCLLSWRPTTLKSRRAIEAWDHALLLRPGDLAIFRRVAKLQLSATKFYASPSHVHGLLEVSQQILSQDDKDTRAPIDV